MSRTSFLNLFRKVGLLPLFRINKSVATKYSKSESPLEFVFELPHAKWCALVSIPYSKDKLFVLQ